MEKTNLLTLVITLTVGIILAGSLLMPVVNDATTTENTFDNSAYGYYQMKELEVGDIWQRDGTTWTLNDETITLSDQDNVSILALDNTAVRQNGYLRGTTQSSNNFVSGEVTEEGILMFNEDKPIAYTSGYGATTKGDYILKTYTDQAYVHGDTLLWVTGATGFPNTSSAANVIIHIEGTIDDGFTITVNPVKNGTTSNYVVGEYTVNYTEVPGYLDLYKITNIQFTLTADNTVDEVTTTVTTNVTYSTFVLPKEITAEKAVHFTDGENALIMALPVLIIIGLVIVALGAIVIKNRD